MKVVFFNSCKSWGGGEKWHYEMAAALAGKKFRVFAVGSPNSEFSKKVQSKGISLQTLSVSGISFLNPLKLYRLVKYFKHISPDTIIINLSADLKIAGMAAKLAGIKNIIYRRGSAIPIKDKPLNRFLFGHIVTNVLANSEETKRTVLANKPDLFPEEKIHIIYNGIHLTNFENIIEKGATNQIVLGNLARLSKQKGQKYLVSLAERLKKKGIDFKLLIGGDGELEDGLKSEVKSKGLTNEVEFLGFIENPKSFLEKIDVFVFPSIWEGFGFSIIEAKLCKKPVVAFKISSNPEVINDNSDGYLVEPFDEDKFFKKTLELIQNSELRSKMGERGRRDSIERFSHEKCVSELVKYLQKLN